MFWHLSTEILQDLAAKYVRSLFKQEEIEG
jgi:hypothetical protein